MAGPLRSVTPASTVFEPIFHFLCWFSGGKKTTTTLNKPLKALVHTPVPWTRYLPRCLDVTLLTDYSFLFVPPTPLLTPP